MDATFCTAVVIYTLCTIIGTRYKKKYIITFTALLVFLIEKAL